MARYSKISNWAIAAAAGGLAGALLARSAVRSGRRIDLKGRTVLITGGSRGLGLALAREFAGQGARLAICARDRDELDAVAEELRGRGAAVQTFVCDLGHSEQIIQLIDEVERSWGAIDILVNNAGAIIVGPAQAMSIDDYKEAMDINFWASVHTTHAIAPKMKARGFGRIVNIASVGGKMPVPHLAPYCASKFALVGFSAAMRIELARDGILVTTVNPGLMRTGSPPNAEFKGKQKLEYAWFDIGDSIPGLSMKAARAARRIVDAAIYGEAEVMLGYPAKLASSLYAIAPSLHLELSALANYLFPNPPAQDHGKTLGRENESWLTRSFRRHFGDGAEREFNQINS